MLFSVLFCLVNNKSLVNNKIKAIVNTFCPVFIGVSEICKQCKQCVRHTILMKDTADALRSITLSKLNAYIGMLYPFSPLVNIFL